MQRRGLALISALSTAFLILSNLLFLGGIHVGRIFWKRLFVQGGTFFVMLFVGLNWFVVNY
uniref:Uncharacterized protein n=1 Tax=Cyprinus carpio TaxID=7962 RepID=A0A8C1V8R0_CYPCA